MVDIYKQGELAQLMPCYMFGPDRNALDKICEKNGAPKIGQNYITSYFNLKRLCNIISKKYTVRYSNEVVEDWTAYAEHMEAKQDSLQRYLDKINERIAPKALFEHQVSGAKFMLTRKGVILADEMGLGKTLQVIAQTPPNAPCIIVSPVNAKHVWKDEFEFWAKRDCKILQGRKSFRWPDDGEVLITNYDILPRDLYYPIPKDLDTKEKAKMRRELKKSREAILKDCPEYMLLVADEGHRLKNSKAQRTKRFRYMAEKVRASNGRVIITTGTPQKKDGRDLHSLLTCIGEFESVFGSYPNFKKQMNVDERGRIAEPKASAKYYLANVMLRRRKEDVLDLPPVIHEYVKVDVDDKYLAICNDFDRACADLGISFDEAFDMAKDPQSSLYAHICRVKAALALSKGPAIEDLVEDYENAEEPIIVGCTHIDVLDVLAKRKGWAIIKGGITDDKRKEICDAFQAGKLKGLALSTLAASEALTLHRACAMIVVDRWWGPTENDQLMARIHRPGQTRTVYIKELLIDHPIEKRIIQLCDIKRKDINLAIEGVADLQKGKKIA